MTPPAAGPASLAVSEALTAVERWNPVVNAMIAVRADTARARAVELDRIAAAGGSAVPCTAG